MENKVCIQCLREFVIVDEDLSFYKKISPTFDGKFFDIPAPTMCPDCRNQRRQTYRNEINFYKRKCDLTGKEVISIYHPDSPATVYDTHEWWSDKWDATEFGRDFDFDFERPFFEQFNELANKTPRPAILSFFSENSDYTNHSGYNKNSYMCVNTGYSENMCYCTNYVIHSKDCVDCLAIQKCENCYECVDTNDTNSSQYLINCNNCNECKFCFDCYSCTDCFGCYNLRHKQFHISNVAYSKEDYIQKLSEISPKTYSEQNEAKKEFLDMIKNKAIHRNLKMLNTENATGDCQWNNKNVQDSFQVFASENCKYCYDAGEMIDSYDVTEPLKGNYHYESHATNDGYNVIFTSKCYGDDHMTYCQYCWNSKDCFGCFGLRHKQYCVLNKQYSKDEYEKLVAQIIEHMQDTKEWGEFFPIEFSPFGYNETVANQYYPLQKEKAAMIGAKWKDKDFAVKFNGESIIPAEEIQPYKDEKEQQKVLSSVVKCEISGKPFRIMPAELAFYIKNDIPLPRKHFDERLKARFALRNPRKLFNRKCDSCETEMKTTYAPERPERVYCESCYQKAVI